MSCAYSLLMRANKLETVISRDHLACLAPPDMVFPHVHASWMIEVMYLVFSVFAGLITAAFSFMLFEFTCLSGCMILWLRCFGCFVLYM